MASWKAAALKHVSGSFGQSCRPGAWIIPMPPKSLGQAFPFLIFLKKGLITIESQEMYRIPEGARPGEGEHGAESEPGTAFGGRADLSGMAGAGPKACTSFRSDRKWKDPGLYAPDPEGTGGGKQAIVLIPEIALTYQTVRRFYAMFGDKVWLPELQTFPRRTL